MTLRSPNRASRSSLSHVLFSLVCAAAPLVTGCAEDDAAPAVTLDPAHPEIHPTAAPIADAPTPAPATENHLLSQVRCSGSGPDIRCQGTESALPPGARNLARNGMRAKGTNSQNLPPANLQLADIDADGVTDFIQFVSNKIFVSKTDYEKTGILHLYTARPIKRILVGDFHGDKYSQTCAITTCKMDTACVKLPASSSLSASRRRAAVQRCMPGPPASSRISTSRGDSTPA